MSDSQTAESRSRTNKGAPHPSTPSPLRPERSALAVTLIYIGTAAAWILGSDTVIGWITSDPALLVTLAKTKGLAFVSVTALLLYSALRRRFQRWANEAAARVAAEQALAVETERRRILVEQSREGIVVLDEAGKVVEANRRFAEMLGYSLADIAELHAWDWDALWPKEAILKMIADESERGRRFETRHRRRDGSTLEVEISVNAVIHDGSRFMFCICRDISERKKVEAALQERIELQQQLSAIADSAPVVIYSFRLSPDGAMSMPYASPTIESIFGVRPQDIVQDATPALAAVHPDDRPALLASIQDAARSLSAWQMEFRVRHPVKGDLWAEGRSTPRRQPDGSIVWFGVLADITDRKNTEAALSASELRFRSLFKNMLEGFAHCRMLYENDRPVDFLYLDVNPAFEKLTGLINVTGRKVSEVIPGIQQTNPELILLYSRVAVGGPPEHFETFVPPLGIWFEISAYSLGEHHFVAVFDNITERKKAEEGLRLQSAALEAAANAIVITDRNGLIQWVNPAFSAQTGYSEQEALGRNPRDLTRSGEHDKEFYRDLWKTILSGHVWRGEIVNRRKDGTLYTEDMTITPLRDEQGVITNFIAIKQDITERKNLEVQLQRNQRLESVGRLASGLAHDLNNILSPALMGPTILREAVSDPIALEIVNSIEASAKRGAAVIKQLLAFGRGAQTQRVPMQLRTLIREMMKLIQETFPKNILARQTVPDDLLLVNGDSTQLHQVLMNLCVNARDSMPNGGTLTMALEETNITAAAARSQPDAHPGRYAVLSVTDTGVGIAPEHMDRIFDPFYTTKPVGEGTGLGLSTVMGIVRDHKGFIQVSSQLGKGTQFRVFLPACEAAGDYATATPDDAAPSGHGEVVLVVDDEEDVRHVARRTLERNGYRVLEAVNGKDALTVYQAHRDEIKVVVTDLIMPIMEGPALILALLKDQPGLRIIAMSGYLSQPELMASLEAQAQAFLAKPFSATNLLETLHRVLAA